MREEQENLTRIQERKIKRNETIKVLFERGLEPKQIETQVDASLRTIYRVLSDENRR